MKKQIELSIPTSWKDLDLYTYLRFQKDASNYEDNEEAQIDFMIYHFCGLEFDNIKGLSVDSYNTIREKFGKFEKPDTLPLQRLITIKGVEYGFEPNLSKMSYGAYVDISQYEELTIDKNWGKIMNILYRPVTSKKGELYTIEPYIGRDDWDKFLSVSMDIHWGSLFFFMALHRDLLNAILSSSMQTELPRNIRSILAASGRTIQQYLNSQEAMFNRWMQ